MILRGRARVLIVHGHVAGVLVVYRGRCRSCYRTRRRSSCRCRRRCCSCRCSYCTSSSCSCSCDTALRCSCSYCRSWQCRCSYCTRRHCPCSYCRPRTRCCLLRLDSVRRCCMLKPRPWLGAERDALPLERCGAERDAPPPVRCAEVANGAVARATTRIIDRLLIVRAPGRACRFRLCRFPSPFARRRSPSAPELSSSKAAAADLDRLS